MASLQVFRIRDLASYSEDMCALDNAMREKKCDKVNKTYRRNENIGNVDDNKEFQERRKRKIKCDT